MVIEKLGKALLVITTRAFGVLRHLSLASFA